MKYLFLILLLSAQSFANSGSGNISNVLTLGGYSTGDNVEIAEQNAQGYFTLYAGGAIGTANHVSYLVKNGSAYQVPTGSSFHAVKICIESDTANEGFQIVSSTNSIGFDVAAPASTTFMGGATAQYALVMFSTIHTVVCFDTTYTFNSASYAGFQVSAISTVHVNVTGKETTP